MPVCLIATVFSKERKALSLEIVCQPEGPPARFVALIEGHMRGFVEYYVFNHVVIVVHTEIESRWEGRGAGSALVRQALDCFRAQNKSVVPVCGFFAHQLRRHPEYADLVSPQCRRIFAL
jgi:predicted GNAT family acetyltransferase